MYEAKQRKENVSRTISELKRKGVLQHSASKSVIQNQVRKDPTYNTHNEAIDNKFRELDDIQTRALGTLYNQFSIKFPISNAVNFFKSLLPQSATHSFLYAYWGSCIEEVMNGMLEPTGWECQKTQKSSRPDYSFKYGNSKNFNVFADATSNNISVEENTHIGQKLRKANVDKKNVDAADIAYPDNAITRMISILNARIDNPEPFPQGGGMMWWQAPVTMGRTDVSKRKSWTEQENILLLKAVDSFGENWSKVAAVFNGTRTRVQCYQKWYRVLRPQISKEPWTEEEDSKLLELVKQGNKNWVKIADYLGNRNDVQCRFRYKLLINLSANEHKD